MRFIPHIVVLPLYAVSQSISEILFQNFDDGIEIYLITPRHMVNGWTTIEIFLQQRSSLMRYLVKTPVHVLDALRPCHLIQALANKGL